MATIKVEIFDHTKEYEKISLSEYNLILDYFNFEYNDIDLNLFLKVLREGKYSKILKDYIHSPSLKTKSNLENKIDNHESIEKIVYEDFKEIYSKITDCYLNLTSYPFYKNTIYDMIKYRFSVYAKKEYEEIYFFILLLSKRKHILGKLFEFYKKKFLSNFENSSILGQQEGLSNLFPHVKSINLNSNSNLNNDNSDEIISNTITIDILKSSKFFDFVKGLTKWYSLAETITLNLGLLNEFFGFSFEFSQEKFSLNKNFGFSLETFAKKNLLKLISYFLKKLTLDINFGEFNYKRILIIFASAFTCGIPLRDFMFKDIKQFAILVCLYK